MTTLPLLANSIVRWARHLPHRYHPTHPHAEILRLAKKHGIATSDAYGIAALMMSAHNTHATCCGESECLYEYALQELRQIMLKLHEGIQILTANEAVYTIRWHKHVVLTDDSLGINLYAISRQGDGEPTPFQLATILGSGHNHPHGCLTLFPGLIVPGYSLFLTPLGDENNVWPTAVVEKVIFLKKEEPSGH